MSGWRPLHKYKAKRLVVRHSTPNGLSRPLMLNEKSIETKKGMAQGREAIGDVSLHGEKSDLACLSRLPSRHGRNREWVVEQREVMGKE